MLVINKYLLKAIAAGSIQGEGLAGAVQSSV